eukprot:scaffold39640_cov477-Skeletonema_dohrnii-CCMP3373.AAC.1
MKRCVHESRWRGGVTLAFLLYYQDQRMMAMAHTVVPGRTRMSLREERVRNKNYADDVGSWCDQMIDDLGDG